MSLFDYGQKRNYVTTNPVLAIEAVKHTRSSPGDFHAEELATVLEHADAELLPMLVIGGFSGLRTSELLQLTWNEVDLVRGFIHITATKSKTARRRLVPITDNLAEWLRPYAGRNGKVCTLSDQDYHRACLRTAYAAGRPRWPQTDYDTLTRAIIWPCIRTPRHSPCTWGIPLPRCYLRTIAK